MNPLRSLFVVAILLCLVSHMNVSDVEACVCDLFLVLLQRTRLLECFSIGYIFDRLFQSNILLKILTYSRYTGIIILVDDQCYFSIIQTL